MDAGGWNVQKWSQCLRVQIQLAVLACAQSYVQAESHVLQDCGVECEWVGIWRSGGISVESAMKLEGSLRKRVLFAWEQPALLNFIYYKNNGQKIT